MSMRKTLLVSVATAGLIVGGNVAFAQGMNKGGDAPAAAAPSAAPSTGAAPAEKAAPMNRSESSAPKTGDGMKAGQAEQKMPRSGDSAQREQDMKTKGANSDTKSGNKAASETTPDGKARNGKNEMKADSKSGADKSGSEKSAAETKGGNGKAGATTGQASAGGKLTSQQRTTVHSAIQKQGVKPVTNINFSISIGTRVPRTVRFHPVPVELVTIYPSWREYEYFLVNDQIVVVNPRTLEIVAVLDA